MAVTIVSPVPHSDWLNYSIRYNSRCNILIKQQYLWWYHGNVSALCTFLNVYNYLNIIVSKSRPLSSFRQGESLTRGISHCSQDDNLWVTGSVSWPHTFGALWTFWQLSSISVSSIVIPVLTARVTVVTFPLTPVFRKVSDSESRVSTPQKYFQENHLKDDHLRYCQEKKKLKF